MIFLLALSAIGVPVGIAMGMVALSSLWWVAGPSMAFISLKTLPYALGTSYTLVVVSVPFLDPIAESLGINPILFAVIIVKLLEIAAVSPPFGLNLFTVLAASDEPIPTGEALPKLHSLHCF